MFMGSHLLSDDYYKIKISVNSASPSVKYSAKT